MTDDVRILDGCAGPGGWTLALADLGYRDLGVDVAPDVYATRAAAGFDTTMVDLSRCDVGTFGPIDAVIMSPPCPLFSDAGKRQGVRALAVLTTALVAAADGSPGIYDQVRSEVAELLEQDPLQLEDGDDITGMVAAGLAAQGEQPELFGDAFPTAGRAQAEAMAREACMVLEPIRWVVAHRPRWVALEQVRAVAPLWQVMADVLRHLGYSAAAGIVDAADYGVPQHRKRAVLIASLDGPVDLPLPTHGPGRPEPWVTMGQALGWGYEDAPARTLCGHRGAPRWLYDDPSGTRGRIAPRRGQPEAVGFPRRDDRGTSEDGYRERDPAGWVWRLNTGRDWEPGGTRADAQQLPLTEPAPTLTGKSGGQWQWWADRPATTVTGDSSGRLWPPGHKVNGDDIARLGEEEARARYGDRAGTNAVRLELWEALALQGFPLDYPLAGTRTAQFRQVGDAVPPALAHALLLPLVDLARMGPDGERWHAARRPSPWAPEIEA